mmetsp:Transcript_131462/g.228501  ORF Transcript_131462/g.228501 Transcript_131462/m.228501 type:complete len:273 (-) Transcript_131462:213-1031(-)
MLGSCVTISSFFLDCSSGKGNSTCLPASAKASSTAISSVKVPRSTSFGIQVSQGAWPQSSISMTSTGAVEQFVGIVSMSRSIAILKEASDFDICEEDSTIASDLSSDSCGSSVLASSADSRSPLSANTNGPTGRKPGPTVSDASSALVLELSNVYRDKRSSPPIKPAGMQSATPAPVPIMSRIMSTASSFSVPSSSSFSSSSSAGMETGRAVASVAAGKSASRAFLSSPSGPTIMWNCSHLTSPSCTTTLYVSSPSGSISRGTLQPSQVPTT